MPFPATDVILSLLEADGYFFKKLRREYQELGIQPYSRQTYIWSKFTSRMLIVATVRPLTAKV